MASPQKLCPDAVNQLQGPLLEETRPLISNCLVQALHALTKFMPVIKILYVLKNSPLTLKQIGAGFT
jgi:hypothetical protein